jgi:hypothetical protein
MILDDDPPDFPLPVSITINASEISLGQIEGIQSQSPFGISSFIAAG